MGKAFEREAFPTLNRKGYECRTSSISKRSERDKSGWLVFERVVSVCAFGELLNICVSEPVISLEKQKNEVGDLSYFIISHSPTAHTRACTNTYFY